MKARYLIILTAVVLGLVVASPVSAFYSLSVSGMSANPAFSPGFQSPIKDFSQQSSPSAFDALKDFGITPAAAQGSVRAYSNGMFQDPNSEIRFSQSVSVTGQIKEFSFSASFNSGMFR
jgi:hypothetical protein